MTAASEVPEVLHRIRVKLHQSNFPKAKKASYAQTCSEAVLSVKNVCASLKERGGFTGNYIDLVIHVKQFFDEAAYQLCDGFGVDTSYFTIYPVIRGFFENANEDHSQKKHLVKFRFRAGRRLRSLTKHIHIEVENGVTGGYIDEFLDHDTGVKSKTVTPGGFFTVYGDRVKICGDNPDCGVWFVSTADPSVRVKVVRHLAVNTSRKITGIAPELRDGKYTVEIKTQYTLGGINLKNPKTVTAGFTLEKKQ